MTNNKRVEFVNFSKLVAALLTRLYVLLYKLIALNTTLFN